MRRLLTPRWLGWHALALLAVVCCLALGYWQFRRATAGNQLSWAYTLQWPVFAGFVGFVWQRSVRDVLRGPDGRSVDEPPPPLVARQRTRDIRPDDSADPELAAYNRYLAWLNANPDRRANEYPG